MSTLQKVVAAAVVVALVAAVGVVAIGQVSAPLPQAVKAPEFVVPKGSYTRLILTGMGKPGASPTTVTIKYKHQQFPVSVGPGVTVILPGWEFVEPGTIAMPAFAPTYPVAAAVKVWALTPTGPVAFAG
jgi:hypothetical protein